MASYSSPPSAEVSPPAPPAGSGDWGRRAVRALVLLGLTLILLWQESRAMAALDTELAPPLAARLVVPLGLAGIGLAIGRPWAWCLLATAVGLLSFLLVGDRAFLAYFHHPLSVEMGVAAGQFWDVRHSTATLVGWADWGALAAVVLGYLALARLAAGHRTSGFERLLGSGLVALSLLSLSAPLEIGVMTGVPGDRGSARDFLDEYGLLTYHAQDIRDALQRRLDRGDLDPVTRKTILATFAHRKRLNDTDSPLFGIARGRNVLLVQLEALQSFVLDWEGPDGPVTPKLNWLSDVGLRFDHCMDTTSMGRTSSAEFQVLTGMPSHSSLPVAFTHMGQRYTTLTSELAARGYATLSMHTYKRHFWNRAVAHPTYGIEEMIFDDDWDEGRVLGWGLADHPFLRQVAERLAAGPKPFCGLVITLSCHHPFGKVPGELKQWPTGLPDELMAAGYLRLARYTDRAVGAFMRRMHELGLAEQTLFVFYGDHDAGLDPLSRAGIARVTGRDPGDPAEDRVPLIFVVPGKEGALRDRGAAFRQTYGGLHDIAPTVMHLLGLPSPVGFLGTHLFVPDAERDILPLPFGQGFVDKGQLFSSWTDTSAETPALAARHTAGQARATAARQLVDLTLDHGLQAVAAATPLRQLPAAPGALADLPLAANEQAWRRTPSGSSSPLPGDVRLLDMLPPEVEPMFSLQLVLTNGAAVEHPYSLRGFDVWGRPVLQRNGRLAPGERLSLAIAPGDPRDEGVAAYALLNAPDDVSALCLIRHFRGLLRRPLVTSFGTRTQLAGDATDVADAAIFLTSFADEPRSVQILVQAEGQDPERIRVPVPPHGLAGPVIDLSATRGPVQLTVVGQDVASSFLLRTTDGKFVELDPR